MLNSFARSSWHANGRRIWVVENDDALRAAIAFSLKAKDFLVSTYASGSDVTCEKGACDCLIVDFDVADMDGIDLLMQLRDAGNTAPAVLIIGDRNSRARRRAEEMKINIVQKPLLGDDLFDAVRKVI